MSEDEASRKARLFAKEQDASSLPVLLLRARLAVAANFRKEFAKHGLSEQQFRIALTLKYNEYLDVSTLVERTDLQQASVSRILRDLEARKLLSRVTARDDARRTLAVLTLEGKKLIEETMRDVDAANARMEQKLGAELVDTARSTLRRIVSVLGDETP